VLRREHHEAPAGEERDRDGGVVRAREERVDDQGRAWDRGGEGAQQPAGDLRSEAGFEPAEESADVDIIEVAIIREMLGELPDHHREVVVMRFIDGFTPSEIAEVTGERENTVSVRIHRALLKLKKAYEARQKKAA
jgi:RNA polymerase sigma factor (sigma-70 family)